MSLSKEQEQSLLVANKLGFVTHCLATGQTEKQASAAYVKADSRRDKMEKLASTILDNLK